jgi:hypothetical protein
MFVTNIRKELAFFGDFDMNSDDDQAFDSQSHDSSTSSQAPTRVLDPEQSGFGVFFTYAACHWTEHLKQCSRDALPNIDDISKLARHGSLTLRNWLETYKRPSLTLKSQRDLNVDEFDELIVAAYFGSHAFLAKFLERDFDDEYVRPESPATAVKWLMQSGDLAAVKILLRNETLGKRLRNSTFLYDIITIWKSTNDQHHSTRSTKQATEEQWKELFFFLVRDFFDNDIASYDWANTILCHASENGCLPMIKVLFEKANEEPDLAKALLANNQTLSPYQSIGAAAFRNQLHVVRYLLTQTHVDITPHLYHRTQKDNMNILHCAAKPKNPDLLRILVSKFPSGVNELTAGGDTPLNLLVFGASATVEAVRVLVEDGKADVNLTRGEGWYAPLRTAVRRGNVEVCRYLAAHGARVDDAVDVDMVSGEVGLRDSLERPDVETSARILHVLAAASELEACKRYIEMGAKIRAP